MKHTSLILSCLSLVLAHTERNELGGVLAGAPVNNVTVSSSNVDQCEQATITWTNAAGPVELKIGTGGYYVGISWLTTLSSLQDSSTSWTVTQPKGTDLIFQITDSSGQKAYQQNVKVGGSSDDSCLSSSPSSAAASPTSGSGSDSGDGGNANQDSPSSTGKGGATADTAATSAGSLTSDGGNAASSTSSSKSKKSKTSKTSTGSATSTSSSKTSNAAHTTSTTSSQGLTPLEAQRSQSGSASASVSTAGAAASRYSIADASGILALIAIGVFSWI